MANNHPDVYLDSLTHLLYTNKQLKFSQTSDSKLLLLFVSILWRAFLLVVVAVAAAAAAPNAIN